MEECSIMVALQDGQSKGVLGILFEVKGLKFHVRQQGSQWIVSDVILGRNVADGWSKGQAIGKTVYMFSQEHVRNAYRWEINRYESINPDVLSKAQAIECIEKGEDHEL